MTAATAATAADVRTQIGHLLTRAQRSGVIRDDISLADLMALITGILFALQARSGNHADPQRAVAVLRDGLRTTQGR